MCVCVCFGWLCDTILEMIGFEWFDSFKNGIFKILFFVCVSVLLGCVVLC